MQTPFPRVCSPCKLLARALFHPLQRMQVASETPFSPFAAHASDQQGPFSTLSRPANHLRGPFSTFSRSANCLRGLFFILSRSANCQRGSFSTLSRSANPEQRSPLPPCTSCKAIAGGFSLHSPTLPTAGNQLFPFILYPDYSNPSPSVKGKSPENPKKAPFLPLYCSYDRGEKEVVPSSISKTIKKSTSILEDAPHAYCQRKKKNRSPLLALHLFPNFTKPHFTQP